MHILFSILVIVFTFMVLVGIHEFGHFWFARRFGIKVLSFSFGFGKVLFRTKDKLGTEYLFSAIPLGGYVRMLDEREASVAPEEQAYAFNRQSILKRTIVILAGPLFNLLLAFIIYWAAFNMGFMQIIPTIGQIKPSSIAAQAGMRPAEEIINIDGDDVQGWPAITLRIIKHLGNPGILSITTHSSNTQKTQQYQLTLNHWKIGDLNPEPVESLGIVPLKPPMPPQFVEIFPDTPAAQAGLLANDLVTAVNNKPVNDWDSFLAIVQHSPGKKLQLNIMRNRQNITLPITVGTQTNWLGTKYGYLGVKEIMPQWTPNSLRKRQYSFFSALLPAAGEVYFFTQYNLVVLQKLVTGAISLQSLGGPLSIFKGTLIAANHGLVAYLIFVAFISISLCIINLLPIPGLDGSQLIYFLIEKLRGGKPVSLAVQVLLFRLGVIALVLLLFQGVVNDLLRAVI